MKLIYWGVFVFFTLIESSSQANDYNYSDYYRFGVSTQQDKQLGSTPGAWIGFSWSDPPWGAWSLQVGFDKGPHIKRAHLELSWEGRRSLSKRLSLIGHIGLRGSIQKYSENDNYLEQKAVRALIAMGVERSLSSSLAIGLRVILLSHTLHNFQELDSSQGRISHVVTDIDQSWLISAQIGVSYLFD